MSGARDDISALKHVRSVEERRSAEEIASRIPCRNFERFRPLFEEAQSKLRAGKRQTRPFGRDASIATGDFFVLGGQLVYVAETIQTPNGETAARIAVRDRTGVRIGEGYMVRTHPQWLWVREIIRSGVIGDLRAVMAAFSYFNRDPQNVRNIPEWGGGGVMDIGCYPITMARFLFEQEPRRACALIERDPDFGTDRLASALLDFPGGQAVFTCSTQLVPYQRVQILGIKGRIEVEIPWNAPPDRPCRITVDIGGELFGAGQQTEEFPVCDQYTIQADLFSRAILEGGEVPVPLEESLRNMAVIEAVLRSGESGGWESI